MKYVPAISCAVAFFGLAAFFFTDSIHEYPFFFAATSILFCLQTILALSARRKRSHDSAKTVLSTYRPPSEIDFPNTENERLPNAEPKGAEWNAMPLPTAPIAAVSTEPCDEVVCPEIPTMSDTLAIYKKLVNNLFASIVTYLSSTTVPISDELFVIRKTTSDFIEHLHTYDHEIENKTTLRRMNEKTKNFSDDMQRISATVENIFASFGGNIDKFRGIIAQVDAKAGEIYDIADHIRIMSINASIESARAGAFGAGFRVIAGEIKTLSNSTESFVKDITTVIRQSLSSFRLIDTEFNARRREIAELLEKQRKSSGDISAILSEYMTDKFEDLYKRITAVIHRLSGSMTKISPIVQLHEITIQEIGNLDLVVSDFIDGLENMTSAGADSPVVETVNPVYLEQAVLKVRERLTTSRELDALENAIRQFDAQSRINLKRNSDAIEMF